MPPIPQPVSTSAPTPSVKRPATGLMIAMFAVVILGLIGQYAMFTMNEASRAKESAMLSARMMTVEKAVSDLASKQAVASPVVAPVPTPIATEPPRPEASWSTLDVSKVASLSAFESRFVGLKVITDLTKPFTLNPGETAKIKYMIGEGDEYAYVSLKTATKPYTAPVDLVMAEVMDGKLSNAKSTSLTLTELQGSVDIYALLLAVTQFTQTGATTFTAAAMMY